MLEVRFVNVTTPNYLSSTKPRYLESFAFNGEFLGFSDNPNNELNYWREALSSPDITSMDVPEIVDYFYHSIEKYKNQTVKDRYAPYLDKIRSTYNSYIAQSEELGGNFKTPSTQSLVQLNRFFPDNLPSTGINLDIYLDIDTGCFGVSITSTFKPKDKRILKILMMDNDEMYYTIIKKRNQILKRTGRAYYGTDLDDSDEIKNIIGMIS